MKRQIAVVGFLALMFALSSLSGCFKKREKDYGIPDDYVIGAWFLTQVLIDGADSTAHAFQYTSPDCSYSFSINRKEEKLSIYGPCLNGVFTLDKKNKKLKTCMHISNASTMLKSTRYPFLVENFSCMDWDIVSITETKSVLKANYDNKTFTMYFDIQY
jgi:hypothetical protein